MGNVSASETTAHSGFHHVTVNVEDVDRAERWYAEVLGFQRVASYATEAFTRVILRHAESGAVLGLSRHTADVAGEPFDERRAGLDHLAFRVEGPDALRAWMDRFDALGVAHSEVKPGAIPGSSLVTFRDPDGLQLEVFTSGS